MNIRLTKLEIARIVVQYEQGNVKPNEDIKIRMRCALEAIIHFGKTLYHAAAHRLDSKNPKHLELRDLYAKRFNVFANSISEPEKYLVDYATTLPLELEHYLNEKARGFKKAIFG